MRRGKSAGVQSADRPFTRVEEDFACSKSTRDSWRGMETAACIRAILRTIDLGGCSLEISIFDGLVLTF
jgi:hypothetical protein